MTHESSFRNAPSSASFERRELFLDLRSIQRKIARIPNRLLTFATEHVAQELLGLRREPFARLAVQPDIHVAGKRITPARGVVGVPLVIGPALLTRERHRF